MDVVAQGRIDPGAAPPYHSSSCLLPEVRLRLFPRLVLLVACVPLLLPPSVCACGAEVAAPSQAARGDTLAPKSSDSKHCGCCHRAKSTAPTDELVSQHQDERPVPHAPSCPIVSGVGRAQLAERAEPADHLTALAFVCLVPTLFALVEPLPSANDVPHSVPSFEAPPRFVAHCALLF